MIQENNKFEINIKKLTPKTKRYIGMVLVTELIIGLMIKIINLRLARILLSLIGVLILIIGLYKIITNKEE